MIGIVGCLRISLVYIHQFWSYITFDWTALKSMDYIDFIDIDGIIEQNLSLENLSYFTLYWTLESVLSSTALLIFGQRSSSHLWGHQIKWDHALRQQVPHCAQRR